MVTLRASPGAEPEAAAEGAATATFLIFSSCFARDWAWLALDAFAPNLMQQKVIGQRCRKLIKLDWAWLACDILAPNLVQQVFSHMRMKLNKACSLADFGCLCPEPSATTVNWSDLHEADPGTRLGWLLTFWPRTCATNNK